MIFVPYVHPTNCYYIQPLLLTCKVEVTRTAEYYIHAKLFFAVLGRDQMNINDLESIKTVQRFILIFRTSISNPYAAIANSYSTNIATPNLIKCTNFFTHSLQFNLQVYDIIKQLPKHSSGSRVSSKTFANL